MNTKRVLIVGLRESSSGKTSLAQAMLLYLREKGFKACGFKPKAGNNIWYDYDVIHEALSKGRLYGKDAKLLKTASGTDLPEEVISPIHRLWTLPPLEKTVFSEVPYFIADRITVCDGGCSDHIVINDALPSELREEELVQKLCQRSVKTHHVSTLDELNSVVNHYYDYATQKAYEKIAEEHEIVVYESYANNALPWTGIRKLDLVLATEPGRVYAYNSHKYLSAVELSRNLRKEITANEVCELLKPLKILKIPPCTSDKLVEKLKEKISELLT